MRGHRLSSSGLMLGPLEFLGVSLEMGILIEDDVGGPEPDVMVLSLSL